MCRGQDYGHIFELVFAALSGVWMVYLQSVYMQNCKLVHLKPV